ncbi:YppG family protein [Aquibacillus albus]|uniref:YppG-like protein n=1 Tax=Aquibacillus albus TaxID=1168171 RepID=A0ABS2N692_9BACI|nr:YppG family protein [Aquibacillus albus]MBM7573563.1 hypothetical protein [Aquibacillus albus]
MIPPRARQYRHPMRGPHPRPPFPHPYHRVPRGVPRQRFQQPSQGLGSLLKDENGNLDMKKIGSGVQNVMGIANQAGPVVKMLSSFLK